MITKRKASTLDREINLYSSWEENGDQRSTIRSINVQRLNKLIIMNIKRVLASKHNPDSPGTSWWTQMVSTFLILDGCLQQLHILAVYAFSKTRSALGIQRITEAVQQKAGIWERDRFWLLSKKNNAPEQKKNWYEIIWLLLQLFQICYTSNSRRQGWALWMVSIMVGEDWQHFDASV